MADRDLVSRSGKGAALTSADHDQNLNALASTTETQTGATYEVVFTDHNKLIELNNASMTCTLDAVADIAAAIDSGVSDFRINLFNLNSAAATVSPTGSDTINGVNASITLLQYESVILQTNTAGDGWDIVGVRKQLASPLLTTPQIQDTSADHQYIFAVNELTADRTVTLPLLTGNDTFVFEAHTQTLTNKTLTSAVLNTSISGTAFLDEDNMASDSDVKAASQQSIKAYVDRTAGTISARASVGTSTSATDTGPTGTVEELRVSFAALSTAGSGDILIRIGDSGGVESTGYRSSADTGSDSNSASTGFVLNSASVAAADVIDGFVIISRTTSNSWVCSGTAYHNNSGSWTKTAAIGGFKTLSGALDRVQLVSTAGNFDGGVWKVVYTRSA